MSLDESGTLLLPLTNAASAPWRPSHASSGMLHSKSFPRQWDLQGAHHHKRCGECDTGAGGLWITKCYPSVVRSTVSLACQCAVGVSPIKALRWGLGSGCLSYQGPAVGPGEGGYLCRAFVVKGVSPAVAAPLPQLVSPGHWLGCDGNCRGTFLGGGHLQGEAIGLGAGVMLHEWSLFCATGTVFGTRGMRHY